MAASSQFSEFHETKCAETKCAGAAKKYRKLLFTSCNAGLQENFMLLRPHAISDCNPIHAYQEVSHIGYNWTYYSVDIIAFLAFLMPRIKNATDTPKL